MFFVVHLKVKPPGLRPDNSKNSLESTTSSSSKLSSNLYAKDRPPSWFATGCSRCFSYVVVHETNPSCPKCKNRVNKIWV